MKAVEKIKAKIIHLLGGVTNRENENDAKYNYACGEALVAGVLKMRAEQLYGSNADEWRKAMYESIKSVEEDTSKRKRSIANKMIAYECLYSEGKVSF